MKTNLMWWFWFVTWFALGCLLTGLDIGKNRSRVLLWLWDKIKWLSKKISAVLTWLGKKVWQLLKWLWKNRSQKVVWVPLVVLLGILLVFLGKSALSGFQMPHTQKIPGVSPEVGAGMRNWALGIIIGVLLLIGEIVLWASVKQGTVAWKTAWKIHGWILGVGAMLVGVRGLWNNTVRRFDDLPLSVLISLCVLGVAVIILFLTRKKSTGFAGGTPPVGGAGATGGGTPPPAGAGTTPTTGKTKTKFAWGTFFLSFLALGAVWIALQYFAPEIVKQSWSGFGWPIAFKTGEYFWLTLIIHSIILLLIIKGCSGKTGAADPKKKGEGMKSVKEGFGLVYLLFKMVLVVGIIALVGMLIIGKENMVNPARISTTGAVDPVDSSRDPRTAPIGRWEKIECPVGWITTVHMLQDNAKVKVRLGNLEYITWHGNTNPAPQVNTGEYRVQSAESFEVPIRVDRVRQ